MQLNRFVPNANFTIRVTFVPGKIILKIYINIRKEVVSE